MAEPKLAPTAQRLSLLVALSGLSIYDLSSACGLSRSTLSAVLRDGRISVESARSLGTTTGARVGWILEGEGDAPAEVTVRRAVREAQEARA